ncbi:transposase [Paraburkholderia sp. SIMBA_054]|uniref:transposase n=1 Tax=Paraburkholderia sp. SIMBA_054 TaxID=3085795 RepID=UPI00397D0C13
MVCCVAHDARYSDLAIETMLMLGCAFKLRLRQTEGLMRAVIGLMGLTVPIPDHTTMSRRAKKRPIIGKRCLPEGPLHVRIDSTGVKVFGDGAVAARETWREVTPMGVESGLIVAKNTLADQDNDDSSQTASLSDQIDGEIATVTADGANDGALTYQMIAQHGEGTEIVIPSRSTAMRSCEHGPTHSTRPRRCDDRSAGATRQARGHRRGWSPHSVRRDVDTGPDFAESGPVPL